IKNPMDLFTINSKLENNQYRSTDEFEKDICLIFRNCYTYNDLGSEIYCLGEELESDFNKIWNEKQRERLKRVRDTDTNSSGKLKYFHDFFAFKYIINSLYITIIY
ncbi:Bromodomain-containing protein, partial [Rhizophagus irregularis]